MASQSKGREFEFESRCGQEFFILYFFVIIDLKVE